MWRERYIEQLHQETLPIVITSDPDGLLQDGVLNDMLLIKGYEIVFYEDPVAFRYLYESKYREKLTFGESKLMVVVVEHQLDQLPYDLLSRGTCLEVTLESLFPLLSATVLRHFSTAVLDVLDQKLGAITKPLDENESIKWVLRQAYGLVSESVSSQGDLLRELIRIHYQKHQLPEYASMYLSNEWQRHYWRESPALWELIDSEKMFYQALQEEWQRLLNDLEGQPEQVLESPASAMRLEAHHPITDSGVRVLVDNLFLEGKLKPVVAHLKQNLPSWMVPGVVDDSVERKRQQLLEQLYHLSERLTEDLGHLQWAEIALWWAELGQQMRVVVSLQDKELTASYDQLQQQLDVRFTQWLTDRYKGLSNLPYLPKPIMVHQVPHYLSSRRNEEKVALVVLDGMGFQQWLLVEEALKPQINMDIHGVFAWIPTITSLSRQAIFAGNTPLAFHDSIDHTQAEAKHWKAFWNSRGVSEDYVAYIKLSGDPENKEPLQTLKEKHRIAGVVIDWMDNLMHKAIQGNRGYKEELKIWLSTGYLEDILTQLMSMGYQVAITSDHGSRECKGIGKPQEGILASSRGKRMRIYKDEHLRDQAVETYGGIPWDHPSLPQNYQVMLAPVDGAFDIAGARVISHGGLSLEEVVVPFIQLSAKEPRKEKNLYEEMR